MSVAPAVVGNVSIRVWTVDACGQKSEVSIKEVDLSLVTTLDEGDNGTLAILAVIM